MNLSSCKDVKTENRELSINLHSLWTLCQDHSFVLHLELLELLSLNKVDQSDCPRVHLQRDINLFFFFFKQGYLYHCAHESTHIKTQNDLKCCEEQAKKKLAI